MVKDANFTFLIDLINPYLPDAKGTSKEETVRLILKHASNGKYDPMPEPSTLNKYATEGITRTAAKRILKLIDKESSSLEGYFRKIGEDQLTFIANKLKKSGISSDVYRSKVPSLLAKFFNDEFDRVASRKNKRKQKISTQKNKDKIAFVKTVSDEMFSSVFRQVKVSEMDVVKNKNSIHAFILKPELFPFSYKNLRELAMSNITNYAIARGVEKTDITGLKAGQLLRKYVKSGIPSNLLGELLTYIFLEHEENALKLYTRAEISAINRTIDSEGMYLKSDGERVQLILGASQLNDNLQEAVDNVVEKLSRFRNNQEDEMMLAMDIVDTTILNVQLGEAKSRAIIQSMMPNESEFDEIASYGLFIGYQFQTEHDLYNCNQEEAKGKCRQIVNNDLQQAISRLSCAIQQHHWQKSSFYVYLLPFTKAEEDSHSIMKDLIGG